MEEVVGLAGQVIVALAPYLAQLTGSAGQGILKGLAGESESAGEQLARSLWRRLQPRVREKPAAIEAAHDLAKAPEDADARAALRMQIRKLLAEDDALAVEVSRIIRASGEASSTVSIATYGHHSPIAGRDFIAGDYNVRR
jgi:hypothetical protein